MPDTNTNKPCCPMSFNVPPGMSNDATYAGGLRLGVGVQADTGMDGEENKDYLGERAGANPKG